jgi:hypothetical protein
MKLFQTFSFEIGSNDLIFLENMKVQKKAPIPMGGDRGPNHPAIHPDLQGR